MNKNELNEQKVLDFEQKKQELIEKNKPAVQEFVDGIRGNNAENLLFGDGLSKYGIAHEQMTAQKEDFAQIMTKKKMVEKIDNILDLFKGKVKDKKMPKQTQENWFDEKPWD